MDSNQHSSKKNSIGSDGPILDHINDQKSDLNLNHVDQTGGRRSLQNSHFVSPTNNSTDRDNYSSNSVRKTTHSNSQSSHVGSNSSSGDHESSKNTDFIQLTNNSMRADHTNTATNSQLSVDVDRCPEQKKTRKRNKSYKFDRYDNSQIISMLVSDENILSATDDEDDDIFLNDDVDKNIVKVTNITIPSLYTPHTLIALLFMIVILFVPAMLRNNSLSESDNIHDGLIAVAAAFVLIGFLVCPNGPFTRPHPAMWQFVLSVSILYLCFLCFILFQSYDGVKKLLYVLDPELIYAQPDTKIYAVDCDKFSKFVESIDLFVLAHFFGNVAKAMVLRHAGILWTLSIVWEITEIAFTHLLPNFAECWWDSYVLDVLLSNGLGIYVGLKLCDFFEMRQYSWESFKAINGTKKKIERVILQFTPERWSQGSWIPKGSPLKRYLQLCILIIFFQLNELNCFFLKHIFIVPSKHYFNFVRLSLILTLVAPSLRQYYVYISDSRCKRLGTHCWVFMCITVFEFLVCIKHGLPLFSNINLINVTLWIILQFFICFLILAIMVSWVRIKAKISGIFSKSQVTRTTKNVLITAIHRIKH